MNQKKNELSRDKDILGMDKPTNQLKPLRKKSDTWFLAVTLILLMIGAVVVYYLRNKHA